MKKTLLLLFALLFLSGSCKTQEHNNEFADTIASENLKELLYIYASDEFEGRETGLEGQKKAVDFIKNFYIEHNIESAIEDNYFQNVPLEIIKTPTVDFKVNNVTYNYYDDFISYSTAPSSALNALEFIYAGYGIQDEKYDNYSNLDVKNKIVVVKGGEPRDKAGNYIISGTKEISKWSNGRQSIASKKETALANGALAVILIDQELFNRYSPYFKKQAKRGGSNRLTLSNQDTDVPFFLVSNLMGEALVPNFNELARPSTIFSQISIDYKSLTVPITSENVAAIIKGSEKPDEYIVISAHLDHLGMNGDGEIYNGADDDGSGTVAILEIAKAFKIAADKGLGPKRSVVFFHATGEEKGLLGSKYYTDYNPIFPLEQTITNLNIDMIGRTDPKRKGTNRNYLYIIGSDKLSQDLHNLSETVNNKYMNIEFDYKYNDENDPNRYYYRSDHYNFAKNNIPVIFYFNGTHDDYHGTGDTADKIEYDLLENRARLVFLTAWEIANREKTIALD